MSFIGSIFFYLFVPLVAFWVENQAARKGMAHALAASVIRFVARMSILFGAALLVVSWFETVTDPPVYLPLLIWSALTFVGVVLHAVCAKRFLT